MSAKQLYEMTAAEYRRYVIDLDWKSAEWQELINWTPPDEESKSLKYGDQIEAYRREVLIPAAQAEGKVIPPEVLKELGL